MIGLDQGQMDFGRPDFDGKARKSRAGAQIEHYGRRPTVLGQWFNARWRRSGQECPLHTIWEDVVREEKTFAEVASDDLFWIADGREIDASIPAQQ